MQILGRCGFPCAGPQKTRLRRSKFAFRAGRENFLASRCSAVAIFVHLVVTPRESTLIWTQNASREVKFAFRLRRATKNSSRQVKICVSPARNTKAERAGPHKTRLRRSKFAFRLRRATKNASWQVKLCVSPARNTKADLGRSVFPAQGHKNCVSGGQKLRFACAGLCTQDCQESVSGGEKRKIVKKACHVRVYYKSVK